MNIQNSQKTHSEIINEIVNIDYEIMDVKLEMQLRGQFKQRNQIPTRRLVNNLMPLQWTNYTRWN